MDEPLSNLDAKLREAVRLELKNLIRKSGKTTIFVTHDQLEALTLSDKIILMSKGEIVQEGSPEELYRRPASSFAADFIGTNNFLPGRIAQVDDGYVTIESGSNTFRVSVHSVVASGGVKEGAEVTICIRPEDLRVVRGGGAEGNAIECVVREKMFSGSYTLVVFGVGDARLKVEVPSREAGDIREGENVLLAFDDCAVLIDENANAEEVSDVRRVSSY